MFLSSKVSLSPELTRQDTVLPISASLYSKPFGNAMRALCSSPVTGFLMGSIALNWQGQPQLAIAVTHFFPCDPPFDFRRFAHISFPSPRVSSRSKGFTLRLPLSNQEQLRFIAVRSCTLQGFPSRLGARQVERCPEKRNFRPSVFFLGLV